MPVGLRYINSQSPRKTFIAIHRDRLRPHSGSTTATVTTPRIGMSSIVRVNVAITISSKMTFGPEIRIRLRGSTHHVCDLPPFPPIPPAPGPPFRPAGPRFPPAWFGGGIATSKSTSSSLMTSLISPPRPPHAPDVPYPAFPPSPPKLNEFPLNL